MNRNLFIVLILSILFPAFLTGQTTFQKTETIQETGVVKSHEKGEMKPFTQEPLRDAAIIWQTSDGASIAELSALAQDDLGSIVGWNLNDQRFSYYAGSNVPDWEEILLIDSEKVDGRDVSISQNGELLLIAYENVIKALDQSNGATVWTLTLEGYVVGIKAFANGSGFFCCTYDESLGESYVRAYNLNNTTPLWSTLVENRAVSFNASDDDLKIIVCESFTNRVAWILDGTNGDILQDDIYYYCNSPTQKPSFSADGSILVFGDFSGYVNVYEWDETFQKYNKKWSASAASAGISSCWVGGAAVSADGSTIAAGTLDFLTSGGFGGSLYVFNTYSPSPIWERHDAGDYVVKCNVSDDGSLVAFASYGPYENDGPDFMIFRKNSSIPFYALSTPGSMMTLSMNHDGSRCIVGGKAVHARDMGSGGLLYYINPLTTSNGRLEGVITLENATDYSATKVEILGIDDYFAYTNESGQYSIKFIPDGTYSVKISKLGYATKTFDNIIIENNETTTLSAELLQNGEPVTNLFATQGAALNVALTWDAYPNTYTGYNIYRKLSLADPFPDEPFVSVGKIEAYTDEEVMPTIDYYYCVTAVLSPATESRPSNVAKGNMSTTFITRTIEAYTTSTTPTIDGILDAGEWEDAFVLDASDFLGTYDGTPTPIGSVVMYFKVSPAGDKLYIACENKNDETLDTSDQIALYIDDNDDGAFPSGDDSEGNFWIIYNPDGNILRFRPIHHGGGVGTNFDIPNSEVAASLSSGYVVFEAVLPIGNEPWMINPSADNTSRMALFVRNAAFASMDGFWPYDNIDLFTPSGFGTIKYGVAPTAPTAPENLVIQEVIPNPKRIILQWDSPDIPDFSHFEVYYSTSEGTALEDFQLLGETIGCQYVYEYGDSEEYWFYVVAYNRHELKSPPSNVVYYHNESIPDINKESFINLYPNPANQTICISSENTIKEIGIYNMLGQLVYSQHKNDAFVSINIAQFQAGMYIVKITTDKNATIAKRLIVVK